MYYTNEYTVIIPTDGSPEQIIKPGIDNAFGAVSTPFKVSSAARILNKETKEQVAILEVGKVYDRIGEAPTPTKKPVKKDLLDSSDG